MDRYALVNHRRSNELSFSGSHSLIMTRQQPAPHLIYCHGFASGPASTSKGKALKESLSDELSTVQIPDLQGDSFFDLTMDGMRQRLMTCVLNLPDDGAPLILAGSSLGAYLCAWVAADGAVPRCAGLLLVAPAFGFVRRWADLLGSQGVDQWRANGKRPFFHYRSNTEQDLGVGFLDSCEDLPDTPAATSLPTVIIHGRNDETAAWQNSLRYSEACTNASYHLLNEGHSVDSEDATRCLIERGRSLIRQVQQPKEALA